jgi:predicted PurR-regulated permease PerM
MDDRLTVNLKILGVIVLGLALATCAVLFLARIELVVVILVGATFFAYLIYPAVAWLQRKRFPRWAAITVIYLVLILLVGSCLAYVGPIVGDEARSLTQEFPTLVAQTQNAIVNANSTFVDVVPLEARQAAAGALDQLVNQLQTALGAFAGQALRLAESLAGFVTVLILVPLLAFYILLDLDRLRDGVVQTFPSKHRAVAMDVLSDIDGVIGGFVRGQLTVAAIVGVMVMVLLLLFRVKYAVLIGAVAGVLDLVPYVGAFAGAIPGVLLAIFEHGPLTAFGLIVGFAVLYEIEGHVIAPAIVSNRVGLTPLLVIVAILIGAELGGVGGMFLSVPVAGIIKVLWKRFVRPKPGSSDVLVDGLGQG